MLGGLFLLGRDCGGGGGGYLCGHFLPLESVALTVKTEKAILLVWAVDQGK